MFDEVDTWKIKAWLMEGYLFLPDLEKMRMGVFSREVDDDKYFEYLPFSWTGPSGLEKINAGAQTLFDMMMISMVNYQVDEFFDSVVARGDLFTIAQLRRSIERLFAGLRKGLTRDVVNGVESLGEFDQDIYHQLEDFLRFVVSYPRIQNASDKRQSTLTTRTQIIFTRSHTAMRRQYQTSTSKLAENIYYPSFRVFEMGSKYGGRSFEFPICVCIFDVSTRKRRRLSTNTGNQIYRARLLYSFIRRMSNV